MALDWVIKPPIVGTEIRDKGEPMSHADEDRLASVASIWAEQTGGTASYFLSAYGATTEAAHLATYSDTALSAAARAASGGFGRKLAPDRWLARLDEADEARRQAKLVEDRLVAVEHSPLLVPGFAPAVRVEALRRLRERNADFVQLAHRRPRPPRWHSAPSPRDRYAPVIKADDAEIAVVAILSGTSQKWQFSKTNAHHGARMFTHDHNGYAPEEDRTYVAGLSDIVDTVSGVIDTHRGDDGGKVFIDRTTVRCAECDWVIAAIEVPYTLGPKAVGICTAIAARKAMRGRRD